MGGSSSRVSPVGVSQQAPTRLAEADGNVELVVEPVAEPAETGVGGHGAAPPAAPAFDEVSEEEAALWETLLHSPAALAASAGISAERLHELFVRASAEVAKNRADAASTAGSRYRVGALREAAAAGDLDKVVSCLAAGVSPNALSEQLAEWGPLQYAARHGHLTVLSALLDAGADPLHVDKSTRRENHSEGETALTQAQYWGHTAAAEMLAARGGAATGTADVVSVVLSPAQESAMQKAWWTIFGVPVRRKSVHMGDNLTQIICSAPEFTPNPNDEHHAVMVGLFKLCEKQSTRETRTVRFGYDWGGSATAEASDADPNRRVRTCCYSLACTCEEKGHWITGPVDWGNPKSVRGSMWWPKYKTKVLASISSEAQAIAARRERDESVRGGTIEIVLINGGPVSQLESRTLPGIVSAAVTDLQAKGLKIALVGECGDDEMSFSRCGFPLCCFPSIARTVRSLHGDSDTTVVFLRTYDAAEYFELWKTQERIDRWECRGQLFVVLALAFGLYAWIYLIESGRSWKDDATGVCPYANDGECDDPAVCSPGTDIADCCGESPVLVWAQVTATGARCNATTSSVCTLD